MAEYIYIRTTINKRYEHIHIILKGMAEYT